jgi:hypothetical protein
MLLDTISPISSRDVAGAEAVHLEERTTAALNCSKRYSRLTQRVSEEEKSNRAIVILAKCFIVM